MLPIRIVIDKIYCSKLTFSGIDILAIDYMLVWRSSEIGWKDIPFPLVEMTFSTKKYLSPKLKVYIYDLCVLLWKTKRISATLA